MQSSAGLVIWDFNIGEPPPVGPLWAGDLLLLLFFLRFGAGRRPLEAWYCSELQNLLAELERHFLVINDIDRKK